jgi:predicted nucleic acid-binding protein
MNTTANKYCLDANVLIEAWQKYYNPKFCPDYWKILIELGNQGKIFIPELVFEEIIRTEDDLSKWLKTSKIPIQNITEAVTVCLQKIYSQNPVHKTLVDNTKARSLADPWVIAHAINEKATVVTKEEKVTALNSTRIKIPNVCDNMGIRWINDFDFVHEIGIKFTCSIK